MKLSQQVPVGLGTVLGLVGTAAAGVTTIVQSVEANQSLLTGANKPAGIIAFAALMATVLGRMFQAAHLPKEAAIAGDVAKLPNALAALAAEAQANVAKEQASPDAVDSAKVAFAQPSTEGAPAQS